jgi:Na+/proline symporter
MSSTLILITVAAYSALLFLIVWLTSRHSNNESYFIGNKSSRWYVVAYGMIGSSLSGVTFMSVPGAVFTTQFSYLQVVLGYLLGYAVIGWVLMPVYYKLNLTSIYTYLEQRFGNVSYKTGSLFFIISRVIGAAFRMYIVVNVIQTFVLDQYGVPFWITVTVFMLLILLYTYEGGVKTIVWTDTLQTTFMILALVYSVYIICHQLDLGLATMLQKVFRSEYARIVVDDVKSGNYFWKNFLGGAAIAIAMTGLDQEMMQKNLSCKNIGEAKKNMFTFSMILVAVNFLFLILGAVLIFYAQQKNISIDAKHTDDLFPTVALNYLGTLPAIIFIIGLISAAYPSADGALTALTTAYCYDFLGIQKNTKLTEAKRKSIRYTVHISMAVLLLFTIVVFRLINNDAVIRNVFRAASYTYGPLLGLYAFGFFTRWQVRDAYVWIVCALSPIICYFLYDWVPQIFDGYKFGFELLIVNGLITFLGLMFLIKPSKQLA